jgi:hypothetical protein
MNAISVVKIYTPVEFIRAEFPEPNLDDDKFEGIDTPSMVTYARKIPADRVLYFVPESTAKMLQTGMREMTFNGRAKFTFCVAKKLSLSVGEVERVLTTANVDSYILDLLILKPEQREIMNRILRNAGACSQFVENARESKQWRHKHGFFTNEELTAASPVSEWTN